MFATRAKVRDSRPLPLKKLKKLKNPKKIIPKEKSMVQIELGSIDEEQVDEIKVAVRMRPLNKRERDPALIRNSLTGERAWKVIPELESIVQLQSKKKPVGREDRRQGKSLFTYDKVFNEDTQTEEVYDYLAKELVRGAVEGRNGSIFAYGQTGAGKTHTMQGAGGSIRDIARGLEGRATKKGIIHMVAEDLFRFIEDADDRDYVLQVSVIEVYNEEVRDLLSKKKDNRLMIREDPASGVIVGAVRREASSLNKLLALLSAGERNRVVARTTLNKHSSRSHIIFCVNIESFPAEDTGSGSKSNSFIQRSNLNLVDLAGSESVRHRSAHSTENRRKEGGSINKSLLTLSLVIQALGGPRRSQLRTGHINYRDSKLTRVLQPSLSGNARLAFICCVTASALFTEETKSTFQFASRIKLIKTKSRINIMEDDVSVGEVQEELKETKRKLLETENRLKKSELENKKMQEILQLLTNQRDEALERADNMEKAKNAAIAAAAEAEAKRSKEKRGSHIDLTKPPVHTNFNRDLPTNEQNGFLSGVVGKIQSAVKPGKADNSAYKAREETPSALFEETINGMPANIRADSSKFSAQSELTHATNYEGQLVESEEDKNISDTFDENYPMLGLVNEETTVSA